MRRRIQILGWTLIWSGLFVFGYLGWQLYGTDVVNSQVQAQASVDLEESFIEIREELPDVEVVEVPDQVGEDTPELVEFYPEDIPEEDTSFAQLTVPSLGLEAVIFEGVTRSTLTKGPGHMPGTALPGQPGNAVISGHRTTYGRPFFDFDQLVPGDRIEVETAIGVHVYQVRESFIVQPTDVWVTDDKDGAWLTLTTCNPKFSARERLIITAELVEGPNAEFVEQMDSLSQSLWQGISGS
jgi:sortase A